MLKNRLPLFIVLLAIACLLPIDGVFAANEASISVQLVNGFMKIAAWGWTVVAVLAGKLMSNDLIYASALGLDKTLFTMWNYMKNFANFTIGFIFVYKIAKSLFAKDAFSIKKELPKFLLASVFVNMSWFLMGALIDLSNVATAAVGSFPQVIINEDMVKGKEMQKLNASIPDKVCFTLEGDPSQCSPTYTTTQSLDRIWARFNDMSGPLLFIGSSIYRFQDYEGLNQDITDFKSFTTATLIKLLIILMFIAPLIALMVINLQRVFYLWLWIVFAPVIVIFEVLGMRPKSMDKIFSLKEIIGMIFQPVFVIGGMAIVLILSIGMYSVLGGTGGANPSNMQVSKVLGVAEIASAPNSSTFYNTTAGTEVTFVGDVFRDVASYAGGLVGYLIIAIFVIMLLWAVVKMSTSSSKLASATFDKVTSLGKDLVMGMNIIPMGSNKVSLASMMSTGDAMQEKARSYLSGQKDVGKQNLSSGFYNTSFGKTLQKLYGKEIFATYGEKDIGSREGTEIGNIGSKSQTLEDFGERLFKMISGNKRQGRKREITLHSNDFKDKIYTTIKNNPTLKAEVMDTLKIKDDNAFTKDALFNGSTDGSKKFIDYLQKNLSGKKISLGAADATIAVANDFTFYQTDGR